MSYICLIANEHGVAAAGDSRLTLYPERLGVHFDTARKVFAAEDQGLVWACCGITIFGGVNYIRRAERILRADCKSMGAKLDKITEMMRRVTRLHHAISRRESAFTLLLSEQKRGAVTVLEIVNGRVRRREWTEPVAVEGGFVPEEALPTQEAVAAMSLEQLVNTARIRTMNAEKQAAKWAKSDKKRVQTVGGPVRVVYLAPSAAE